MCCTTILSYNVIKYSIEIGIFKVVRFANNLNRGSTFKMAVFSESKMNTGRKILISETCHNARIPSSFVDPHSVNHHFPQSRSRMYACSWQRYQLMS